LLDLQHAGAALVAGAAVLVVAGAPLGDDEGEAILHAAPQAIIGLDAAEHRGAARGDRAQGATALADRAHPTSIACAAAAALGGVGGAGRPVGRQPPPRPPRAGIRTVSAGAPHA